MLQSKSNNKNHAILMDFDTIANNLVLPIVSFQILICLLRLESMTTFNTVVSKIQGHAGAVFYFMFSLAFYVTVSKICAQNTHRFTSTHYNINQS